MELKTTRWELVHDGIGLLTLARPERHNAWTGRMHTEIRHLLQSAEDDPAVRVVVITGDPAGRAFCPGADSQALDGHAERGGYDAGTPADIATPGFGVRAEFDADFAFFLGLQTVTIAAVNGAAAGVGLVLACWSDLRFAAQGAKLTTAHGKLNLPAEYGLSWLLPRIIGQAHANDLVLSSRAILAEDAERMGLVNSVHPAAEVVGVAVDYARRLVRDVSPHALRASKRQLALDTVRNDPGESVRDAQARLDQMMTEPDYREAIRAFFAEQPPDWSR